jgi:vacuolar-type H+-ATPase subunit H
MLIDEVTCEFSLLRGGCFLAGAERSGLYHPLVADHEASPPSVTSAADRVGSIVAAAEAAGERIRAEAERRMRDRIAEADRAAEHRVRAAEEEAAEILATARKEAAQLVQSGRAEGEEAKTTATSQALTIIGRAQENADSTLAEATAEATRLREQAEERARELLRDARSAASDVRTEGLELAGNLREMGDSMRSNAERLLRDVQMIHSRMVAEIDRTDGGASRLPVRSSEPLVRDRERRRASLSDGGEVLDVPEFIPPG